MGITFNIDGFIAKIKEFKDSVAADVSKLTDTVAIQTQAELSTNLDNAVYNTAPGMYMRSGNLKSLAYASKASSGETYTVIAGDKADYASDIEFGRLSGQITESNLLSRAESSGGEWTSYSRSGINWMYPGAYLTPAIYKASLKMNIGFDLIIKDRWSKSG
jgi:hypothetical protein